MSFFSYERATHVDDAALHLWAGPLGLHLFWPDFWESHFDWLPKDWR